MVGSSIREGGGCYATLVLNGVGFGAPHGSAGVDAEMLKMSSEEDPTDGQQRSRKSPRKKQKIRRCRLVFDNCSDRR